MPAACSACEQLPSPRDLTRARSRSAGCRSPGQGKLARRGVDVWREPLPPQEGSVDAACAQRAFQRLPRLPELVQQLAILARLLVFRRLCRRAAAAETGAPHVTPGWPALDAQP